MTKFSYIYLIVIIIAIVFIAINCIICAFIVNVEFIRDSGVGCFCFLKPLSQHQVVPYPNNNNNIPANDIIPVQSQIVIYYDEEEKRNPEYVV